MKATLIKNLFSRPQPTNKAEAHGHLNKGSVIDVVETVQGDLIDGISTWHKAADGFFYWGGGVEELASASTVSQPLLLAPKNINFPPRPFNWNKNFFGIEQLAPFQGAGITIAVLDDGLDINHDDFFDAYNKVIDTTGNNTEGLNYHGTAVAGIIGARNSNSKGIIGVAPTSILVPIRISRPNDHKTGYAIAGIEEALKAGADIINISMSISFSDALDTLITKTVAAGIPIVASAGDQKELINGLTFPARNTSCIAVGSCSTKTIQDIKNELPDNLHFIGGYTERWVCSNVDNQFYTQEIGSSFTCAYISGLLALLFSQLKQQGQNIKKIDRATIINKLIPCITKYDDVKFMDNTGFGFDIVSRIKTT